ncbi:MAG: hypothetical protein C5B59_02400 [Bacteroidetes bacterium]|nr:MAG: hypothetical protein C5B59_02400 [Bacteroidota bacterium]
MYKNNQCRTVKIILILLTNTALSLLFLRSSFYIGERLPFKNLIGILSGFNITIQAIIAFRMLKYVELATGIAMFLSVVTRLIG